MNQLNTAKRAQIVAALVEGNSLRATSRMTGASKVTILRLLESIGAACGAYQDKVLRNLNCKRVQCDEIWSFCYAKEKNVPQDLRGKGYGDVWTWVAICADTKLVPCWRVGDRNAWTAQNFMHDLASRLANRVQLTTDGHRVYLDAVELAFGNEIDYAMLVKIYGSDRGKGEIRYSPPDYMGCRSMPLVGNPDPRHISTSFAERQNLTMRMKMRRFTRLTNAFSKKRDNHRWAIALHYMHYNFCRVHQTLRVTPAMEAGISDHVWSIEELVALLDAEAARAAA
jgi:IS1 family transposase/lambda repressor-like predicted transcriptional regulator